MVYLIVLGDVAKPTINHPLGVLDGPNRLKAVDYL